MAWSSMTVIDVPGADPAAVAGFSQPVDIQTARDWINAIVSRTSAAVEANATTWALQFAATRAAWQAIESAYRAMNLRWIADPAAGELWNVVCGSYSPVDPSPTCTAETPGPWAILTGQTVYPRPPVDLPVDSTAGMAWRETHPPIVPEWWDRTKALWMSIGNTIGTQEVAGEWSPEEREYQIRVGRNLDRGLPAPPRPPGLPIPPTRTVSNFNAWIVAPVFLSYVSKVQILDTSSRFNGQPTQQTGGLFTGAACGSQVTDRDTMAWSWDCWRWDNAPGQTLRIIPPLRWSFELARRWGALLKSRGVETIVSESRIHQILVNLERAREFSDSLSGFDERMYDTLKQNRTLQFNSAKDRATLQAIGSTVCGAAALVGGAPGLLCAGAAAAADAVLGLIPRAVGCYVDEWGQILPSALRAQISRNDPPEFTVPPPPEAPERSAIEANATRLVAAGNRIRLDKWIVGTVPAPAPATVPAPAPVRPPGTPPGGTVNPLVVDDLTAHAVETAKHENDGLWTLVFIATGIGIATGTLKP